MLKQTISYNDFDDNPTQETLYFNLTKSELADNLHLSDELTDLQELFKGERKPLETSDIQRVVNLVKTFMQLSYGVRSSDGKRFIKTEEQWIEFTQTAAYDAFLYSLFEKPDKALVFMTGILPSDMREVAKQAAETGDVEAAVASALEGKKDISTEALPAYREEKRAPTTKEFLEMSAGEIAEAKEWMTANNIV